jgi:VanZ family protein
MALIFALSSMPDPMPPLTQRVWDKGLHFVEYGTLAALLVIAFRASGARGWRALVMAVVAASLYGVTDELHQAFVPNRSCDYRDWIADTIGGVLGASAVALALRLHRSRASIRPAHRRT